MGEDVVRMGMGVDEPRGESQAVCVDRGEGLRIRQAAKRLDPPASNQQIGSKAGPTGAVDDDPVPDQHVLLHLPL